jgi:hypothetical protein
VDRDSRSKAASKANKVCLANNRSKAASKANKVCLANNRSSSSKVAKVAHKADRANKDCPVNRSNSASKVPAARRRSSRAAAKDHKADHRKAGPDNLDKASKDCLVSRSNSASRAPVARRKSSKAAAKDHKADHHKADHHKADLGNRDKANRGYPASRSSLGSRVLADRSKAAPDNKACLDSKAFRSKVVREACPLSRARLVNLVSQNNSASRAPVARSRSSKAAQDNRACLVSKGFRSKVAREACPLSRARLVNLVSRNNSASKAL